MAGCWLDRDSEIRVSWELTYLQREMQARRSFRPVVSQWLYRRSIAEVDRRGIVSEIAV
jgi:hypothetical protein